MSKASEPWKSNEMSAPLGFVPWCLPWKAQPCRRPLLLVRLLDTGLANGVFLITRLASCFDVPVSTVLPNILLHRIFLSTSLDYKKTEVNSVESERNHGQPTTIPMTFCGQTGCGCFLRCDVSCSPPKDAQKVWGQVGRVWGFQGV